MDSVKVVRSVDGKLLGVTYDDVHHIDRRSYESWSKFLHDFALIACTRIPCDKTSDFAIRLIEADAERLK